MKTGLSITALLATAAFAPAAFGQTWDIETADGAELIAECQDMLSYIEENDTEGTGMTMDRARTIAQANQVEYCTDGLRLAQGEISEDQTAENYDAEAAARLLVAVPEPEVTVTQTAPDVTVAQQSPQVQVDPGQPTVTVEQAQPTVRVQMQPPRITIDMPKPRIVVEMPDPSVDVAMQEPRVSIEQDPPQVSVEQGDPELRLNEDAVSADSSGEPEVTVDSEQATVRLEAAENADVQVSETRPNVQYSAAEPQIEVEQGGDPQIEFNQSGEADVQFRQMSADETRQRADEARQAQTQQAEAGGELRTTGAADAMAESEMPEGEATAEGDTMAEGDAMAEGEMSVVEPSTNLTEGASLETATLSIEELLDKQVVGAEGDTIGDVEDVLFRGDEAFVIVGQGGFLGLGEEQVALPLSDMTMRGDEELVMRSLSEGEAVDGNMSDFQSADPTRQIDVAVE